MKKRSTVLGILIAFLIVVGAGYTYSRYLTSKSGSGDVVIANWAVALKQNSVEVSEGFNLTLTPVANANVASGRIAPGSSATATLELDLTGSEVAADYEIDLSSVTGLPDGMTISSVTATPQGGSATTLTGTNGKYSGQVALADVGTPITFVITVTWENSESRNSTDTTAGEDTLANRTKSIPVTVTAKQHIGA